LLLILQFIHIHRTSDEIIEAYAKAVNISINETEEEKQFYCEDTKIMYCSCFHPHNSHIIIEVILKGQTTSDDHIFHHLSVRCQGQKSSIKLLISPQTYKYDIMTSYTVIKIKKDPFRKYVYMVRLSKELLKRRKTQNLALYVRSTIHTLCKMRDIHVKKHEENQILIDF